MGFNNGYDSGYDDGFADGVKSVQSGSSSGGRQPSPAISSSGGPSGLQQAAAPAVPSVDCVIVGGYGSISAGSDGFLSLTANGDFRNSLIIVNKYDDMSKALLVGSNLGSAAKVELLSGTADVVIPSDFWKVVEAGLISLKFGDWWDSYKAQLYIAAEAVYDKTATGLEVSGDFDEILGDIRVTLESGATCTATGFCLATESP